MPAAFYPCGPALSAAERKATELVLQWLDREPGTWYVAAALLHAVAPQEQPETIDLLVLGPPGLFVLDVRAWTKKFYKATGNRVAVRKAAERLERMTLETVRRGGQTVPASACLILTGSSETWTEPVRSKDRRGIVEPFALPELPKLFRRPTDGPPLSVEAIESLKTKLFPPRPTPADGPPRQLGDVAELRLLEGDAEGFRRVFRGIRRGERQARLVHLYDLTALPGDDRAEALSRREFDALVGLGPLECVPRIDESWKPLPGYEGELAYFTTVDPDLPTLAHRARDAEWSQERRLRFAAATARELGGLHRKRDDSGEPILHRNLNPQTILVRHDDRPVFTGLRFARLPERGTIGPHVGLEGLDRRFLAPEILQKGLTWAGIASDAFALAKTLRTIFPEGRGELDDLFHTALDPDGGRRPPPAVLASRLERFARSGSPDPAAAEPAPLPAVEFWSEGLDVPFRGNRYRVLQRLGAGNFGTVFKVLRVGPDGHDDQGFFTAKTYKETAWAEQVLDGHRRAQAHLRHAHLAPILDFDVRPQPNSIAVLLGWIEGNTIDSIAGVVELLARDGGGGDPEDLLLEWLENLSGGLGRLHSAGLIHGDVAPKNILLDDTLCPTLTDYDLVRPTGQPLRSAGTLDYCAPEAEPPGAPAVPSHDIYSLAASLFQVATGRKPFVHDGRPQKELGPAWTDAERSARPFLARFLERATHPDPTKRFSGGNDAVKALRELRRLKRETPVDPTADQFAEAARFLMDLASDEEPADELAAPSEPSPEAVAPSPEPETLSPPVLPPPPIPFDLPPLPPVAGDGTELPPPLEVEAAPPTPVPVRPQAVAVQAVAPLPSPPQAKSGRYLTLPDDDTLGTPQAVPRLKLLLKLYPQGFYGNEETRGLDSDFARETYVETELERLLERRIRDKTYRLVVLCGNAGDGKTALLQHLSRRLTGADSASRNRVLDARLPDGRPYRVNLDGSAAFGERSALELLDDLFAPFLAGPAADGAVHLLAVNDGQLWHWIGKHEDRHGPTRLTEQLKSALTDRRRTLDPHVAFFNLNDRSLVGGYEPAAQEFAQRFLDDLLTKLLGDERTAEIWRPCLKCSARRRCQARQSVKTLAAPPETPAGRIAARVRRRLGEALQAVHQQGEVHITTRDLRGALSYVFFGLLDCDDLHAQPEARPPRYWDAAFASGDDFPRPERAARSNGEVDPGNPTNGELDPADDPFKGDSRRLTEKLLKTLTDFDPAHESHPKLDRHLRKDDERGPGSPSPGWPELRRDSARRRAYFEWVEPLPPERGGDAEAAFVGLAGGKHHERFRQVAALGEADRRRLAEDLCRGLSRQEELPDIALGRIRRGMVPLRIKPRTEVETFLWVEKPLARFSVRLPQEEPHAGFETLHTHVELVYRPADSARRPEVLSLDSRLFHVLLEQAEGFRSLDGGTDDLLAHLRHFRERLVQESLHELVAWTPALDARGEVLTIRPEPRSGRRTLAIVPLASEP